MTIPHDNKLAPLVASRTFSASREQVFRAWSSAAHLKQWFCPERYTVPEAEVELRAGGVFNLCMRSPTGENHWIRGHYTEIVPDERLVIAMQVFGANDLLLFHALTTVTLADEQRGTRLDVTQTYTPVHPLAEQMIAGAPEGWKQTLERLALEVARIRVSTDVHRSVVHATLRIERTYDASRERVFLALTDPAAKAKWFAASKELTTLAREIDVRPGGREYVQGRWASGIVSTFDARYLDVVRNERLVYVYELYLDDRKISVSLTTFELQASGTGTRLVMTEQGAYLDGYDDAGAREHGSNLLLDALGHSVLEDSPR